MKKWNESSVGAERTNNAPSAGAGIMNGTAAGKERKEESVPFSGVEMAVPETKEITKKKPQTAEKSTFFIGKTPAVLYGEKAPKAFLFVHGQGGNKEEAERFFRVAQKFGYAVLSVDLPMHGGRTDGAKFLPWEVVPELKAAFSYLKARYQSVSVRATSIGAYFSLLAFPQEKVEKCLFVSPLFDMENMILGMMQACGVTEERLQKEREIETPQKAILSWEYLFYARANPVKNIAVKTEILCASGDEVVPHDTVVKFAKENDCGVVTISGGEHYIHTENDVRFMEKWEAAVLSGAGAAEDMR